MVDLERVHGLEKLAVTPPVFPTVPNGNINAPVIMVAEKISDKILGLPALPKAEVPLHLPDNWETQAALTVRFRCTAGYSDRQADHPCQKPRQLFARRPQKRR